MRCEPAHPIVTRGTDLHRVAIAAEHTALGNLEAGDGHRVASVRIDRNHLEAEVVPDVAVGAQFQRSFAAAVIAQTIVEHVHTGGNVPATSAEYICGIDGNGDCGLRIGDAGKHLRISRPHLGSTFWPLIVVLLP